jgi:dihydrofolate reductase
MRLIVISHLTLDGVMQSNGQAEPELNDGFEQGGWQVPYFDEDFGRFMGEWLAAADALLLGRRTYELFFEYWSKITDPSDAAAGRMNGLPKYVVSRTLERVEWENSTLLEGDLLDEITRLKDEPGHELQVHGSGTLIRSLMEHDLIDEYRLLIHPVILGDGGRLFADGTTPTALQLVDTMTTSRGVVVHVYRAAGRPRYGSVALEQEGDVVKGTSAATTRPFRDLS